MHISTLSSSGHESTTPNPTQGASPIRIARQAVDPLHDLLAIEFGSPVLHECDR
jgi:hypothetical protein